MAHLPDLSNMSLFIAASYLGVNELAIKKLVNQKLWSMNYINASHQARGQKCWYVKGADTVCRRQRFALDTH